MIVYHGTIRKNLAKIMTNGLLPKSESDSNWQCGGKSVKAIGFTKNKIHAIAYANRKAILDKDIPIILSLEYDEDKLHFAYGADGNEVNCVASLSKIPAKHIVSFDTAKIMNESKVRKILGLVK